MKHFNHFNVSELFKHCNNEEISICIRNNYIDSLLVLLTVLDGFRDMINFPIFINSSFRDFSHNKSVGGSSTSQHLIGQAIDFSVPNLPFDSVKLLFHEFLEKSALTMFVGQVIFYPTKSFIHIGLRTPSHGLTFQTL